MIVAALLATALALDPRVPILELQQQQRLPQALAEVERLAASDPESTRRYGLDLLRGDLLTRLGRPREGAEAYALAIASAGDLAPWARLHLARTQESLGHPEVAAGLAATLLTLKPPATLLGASVDQLGRAVRRGGDCRLLAVPLRSTLPRAQARKLRLLAAECALREGREGEAAEQLQHLLDETFDDLVALRAADLWLGRWPPPRDARRLAQLAEAVYRQRDFARAVPLLETALAGAPTPETRRREELHYALGRAQFWLGRYSEAATTFARLAAATQRPTQRADALYQQGRSCELARDAAAAGHFARAYEAEPLGEWAAPAILARLRLAWSAGDLANAEALLEVLGRRPPWRTAQARGALFLLSSEIASGGSPERAARWLRASERGGTAFAEEQSYWRGRLAELDGRGGDAVRAYVALLGRRPFHPLAAAARERLAAPQLADAIRATAQELQARGGASANHALWSLHGDDGGTGSAARERAIGALAKLPGAASWLAAVIPPARQWPLWRRPLDRAEERLLALGFAAEGMRAIAGYTGLERRQMTASIAALAAERGEADTALEAAERLFEARPPAIPFEWVAPELRRLLFPLPLRGRLLAESARHGIDPWLLAAVLREESRFAADAVSPVGARGLAQLVLPTAQRLAGNLELAPPDAEALHDPELSITLGAAYLAELWREYGGNEAYVAAAYNAGEAQVDLWRGSCRTGDPAEFLAKIGFRETRAYVVRVLESRAAYAALYREQG